MGSLADRNHSWSFILIPGLNPLELCVKESLVLSAKRTLYASTSKRAARMTTYESIHTHSYVVIELGIDINCTSNFKLGSTFELAL